MQARTRHLVTPLVLALCVGSACAEIRPTLTNGRPVRGLPLIIQVAPDSTKDLQGPHQIETPEGLVLPATLHRASVDPLAPANSCEATGWLGQLATMREIPASGTDLTAGTWFLRVDPLDAGTPETVLVDGHIVRLRWLPSPVQASADAGLDARTLAQRSADASLDPVDDPWGSPVPVSFRDDPVFLGLVRPAIDDPALRWRVRLSVAGLHPIQQQSPTPGPIRLQRDDLETPEVIRPNTIVDDLADYETARWQLALLRLWIADRKASLVARRALAGAVRFEPADITGVETAAPFWLAGERDADALLDMAVRADLSDRQLTERIDIWRHSLPYAFAFTLDDAGNLGPLGDSTTAPAIMVGSLRDAPTLAIAKPVIGRSAPPIEVEAWSARIIEFDAGVLDAAAPTISNVDVSLGDLTQNLRLRSGTIPARPPGVVLGPLVQDATLPLLLADDPTGTGLGRVPDQPMVARLERRLPDADTGRTEPAWILYLECRATPLAQTEQDVVKVWLGPSGEPSARIRVDASGEAADELSRLYNIDTSTRVVRTDTHWAATITLPDSAIPPSGVIRIGLERTEPCGRRTAYPRPMLPWEEEPARIAIDTGAWRGLDTLEGP